MVAPLTFGGGITVGGGVNAGAHNGYQGLSTIGYQNVAGSAGAIGFFFTGSWSALHSIPNLNQVAAGWRVNNDPNWLVVSTDPTSQTVTSNGYNDFQSGQFYSFTGN